MYKGLLSALCCSDVVKTCVINTGQCRVMDLVVMTNSLTLGHWQMKQLLFGVMWEDKQCAMGGPTWSSCNLFYLL